MSTLKTNRIEPVGSTAGTVTVDGTMVFAQGATFPGGISVGQFAYFSSGVTVANTGSFGGLLTLAGATSSGVISCATAPTQGQHLANKAYVDSNFLNNSSNVKVMSFSGSVSSGAAAYSAQPTITSQNGGSGVTFTTAPYYVSGNIGGWYLVPSVGTWVFLCVVTSGVGSGSSGIITPTSTQNGLVVPQGGGAYTSANSSIILIRIA